MAALDLTNNEETVLIIHAGGESSRCPTQMALGKSWTSLPCNTSRSTSNGRTNGAATIADPTSRMVQQLTALNVPSGSVVVAASDTLLSVPMDALRSMQWSDQNSNDDDAGVIGLAVPAPLATATHHGVYCLVKDEDPTANNGCRNVQQFLQKPTIVEMQETPNCVFQHPVHQEEESAWIDTGVVIFLPKAVAALRTLCDGVLSCCTERGLAKLYDSDSAQQLTKEEFAANHALRVELYTHFLLSLSTGITTTNTYATASLEQFISSQNDLPVHVLTMIYTTLAPIRLCVITLPHGQFLHLGTSRELVDFMIYGTSSYTNCTTINEKRCHAFGQEVGLMKRLKSVCVPSKCVATSTVMVNCVIRSTNTCTIGTHTVVEHCDLDVDTLSIGNGCLISGIRGTAMQLMIPDNMCFQMLPENGYVNGHVYMYFGLNDDIKSGTMYYGVDLNDLMKWTGLCERDLWADGEHKRVLWTAHLHPVISDITGGEKDNNVMNLQHDLYFAWITEVKTFTPGSAASLSASGQASFQSWLASSRLPLNKIRNAVDAKQEWTYRSHLEETRVPEAINENFNRIKTNLLERQNAESDLDFIVDQFAWTRDTVGVTSSMKILDEVIALAMEKKDHDVASRSFMVASAMLESLAVASFPYVEEMEIVQIDFDYHELSSSTVSDEERKFACLKLISLRNSHLDRCSVELTSEAYLSCSVAMELAASALTELCICGTATFDPCGPNKEPSIIDKWVLATAPARIDLSGGWSDTPPVCYEYGGAVCGVAVTIDGCYPVSCRCRIVMGGEGILLRTESRNRIDGVLESEIETHLRTIADISDFRDPLAQAALIKCALVYFRLVPMMDSLYSRSTDSLQPFINSFCGVSENVGLEIISTSLLPRGSGMGTSSILGGCILAAIAKCIGFDIGSDDDNRLTQIVLMLEQFLTTGGGWQDQIGGLVGGFKLGTSKANEFPLSTNIKRLKVSDSTIDALNSRLVLVFTGHTRLAKNILQNVLRRWARRTLEIVETVQGLVSEANRVSKALEQGNIDVVADCLNEYWHQKKIMAGADSGVEPTVVRNILNHLLTKDIISAGSLCGAGGGGFMVMLTKEGKTIDDVRNAVQDGLDPEVKDFTWHVCTVAKTGLQVSIVEAKSSLDWFDIAWHRVAN